VLEAIHAFEESTGIKLNYSLGPRRAGDVEAVYADYSKAARLLGWEPQYQIRDFMQSAWAWDQHLSLPGQA
jgi:UDP-glucose 4-epimerase